MAKRVTGRALAAAMESLGGGRGFARAGWTERQRNFRSLVRTMELGLGGLLRRKPSARSKARIHAKARELTGPRVVLGPGGDFVQRR